MAGRFADLRDQGTGRCRIGLGAGGEHDSLRSPALEARGRPRHRRICRYAGGNSGIGGRDNSSGRLQRKHRIFCRRRFNSVTIDKDIGRASCQQPYFGRREELRLLFEDSLTTLLLRQM